jgi:hypothetical protein
MPEVNRRHHLFVYVFWAALVGITLGIVNAIMYQPPRDPRSPLRNEWYIFAYIGGVFWGSLAGIVFGTTFRFLRSNRIRQAGVGGIMIGLGTGMLVGWLTRPERGDTCWHGLLYLLVGAGLGFFVGILSAYFLRYGKQ